MIGDMVKKMFSKTLSNSLVEVKPFGKPSGQLFYMDLIYRDIVKERKEKLDYLLDKMENREKEKVD